MKTEKLLSNINILPEEILTDILMHVASDSIADLANAMLSCKTFLGASNSNSNSTHIFQNISMEKFNPVPWYTSEKAILKKCKKAGNVEALYRKGMLNIFSRNKPSSGFRYLNKAANGGHVEAIYVYGIILICMGGDLRDQGLQILSSLDLRNYDGIACCRSKTEDLLSRMWVHLSIEGLKEPTSSGQNNCRSCNYIVTSTPNCSILDQDRDRAWKERNYIVTGCDSCFWDREAKLFSSIIRNLRN